MPTWFLYNLSPILRVEWRPVKDAALLLRRLSKREQTMLQRTFPTMQCRYDCAMSVYMCDRQDQMVEMDGHTSEIVLQPTPFRRCSRHNVIVRRRCVFMAFCARFFSINQLLYSLSATTIPIQCTRNLKNHMSNESRFRG